LFNGMHVALVASIENNARRYDKLMIGVSVRT
jgi:hypothetical protein